MSPKNYFRIMLGQKSALAEECYKGEWFGGGIWLDMDLTHRLPDDWRQFNKEFIPVFLENNPEKSKITAGLACGMLYTICKDINQGDLVLCPDGAGAYYVGEVVSDYQFVPSAPLRHQRKVIWYPQSILRSDMSDALRGSTGSSGTVCNISKHAEEIENLIHGNIPPKIIPTDELIEDPSVFALEKHLEDFLVKNWACTELGRDYDIFEEDGELLGQQFLTDTGRLDILAISKDKNELLIVELKKGRASDAVVGQIQRYMGFVLGELAEAHQTVKGVIVALEDDLRLRRALTVAPNIEFYRYEVKFKLYKSD